MGAWGYYTHQCDVSHDFHSKVMRLFLDKNKEDGLDMCKDFIMFVNDNIKLLQDNSSGKVTQYNLASVVMITLLNYKNNSLLDRINTIGNETQNVFNLPTIPLWFPTKLKKIIIKDLIYLINNDILRSRDPVERNNCLNNEYKMYTGKRYN